MKNKKTNIKKAALIALIPIASASGMLAVSNNHKNLNNSLNSVNNDSMKKADFRGEISNVSIPIPSVWTTPTTSLIEISTSLTNGLTLNNKISPYKIQMIGDFNGDTSKVIGTSIQQYEANISDEQIRIGGLSPATDYTNIQFRLVDASDETKIISETIPPTDGEDSIKTPDIAGGSWWRYNNWYTNNWWIFNSCKN